VQPRWLGVRWSLRLARQSLHLVRWRLLGVRARLVFVRPLLRLVGPPLRLASIDPTPGGTQKLTRAGVTDTPPSRRRPDRPGSRGRSRQGRSLSSRHTRRWVRWCTPRGARRTSGRRRRRLLRAGTTRNVSVAARGPPHAAARSRARAALCFPIGTLLDRSTAHEGHFACAYLDTRTPRASTARTRTPLAAHEQLLAPVACV
jgi:hypothetical protein